jgi:hypothetical protein
VRILRRVATRCEHVDEVRDDWATVADPVCEECARAGARDWVSLRRCLTCGHVGCCDSSPGTHATAHRRATSHPMVRALGAHDWVWCYVDEVTLRHTDGDWVEVDLFQEVGLTFMRDHVAAGRDPSVGEGFETDKGFPLGRWVAEMRRRRAAGELDAGKAAELDRMPGWRWDA